MGASLWLGDFLFKAVFVGGLGGGGGVGVAEAGGAEALGGRAVAELVGAVQAQIAQGVDADDLRNLLHGVVAGDEVISRVDVGAVVAGVDKGRGGDAHVDLLGAGVPQELDDSGAGGAADDGIVDEHHALAPHHLGDGVQFDLHLVLPGALAGGDEGAGDVAVFDEPHGVGDAGLVGVA